MTPLPQMIDMLQKGGTRIHLCRASSPKCHPNSPVATFATPGVHLYFELAICISGSMQIVTDHETVSLSTGDAALIAPGVWHYETYARKGRAYQSLWLCPVAGALGLMSGTYRHGEMTVGQLLHLADWGETMAFPSMQEELIGGALYSELKARLTLLSLLIDLERRLHEAPTRKNTQRLEPVQRLFHIIRSRFREPLQLADLAIEVGMSRAHLSRRFHSLYGVSFRQCLNAHRIGHARRLLGEGVSIKETAEAAGFEDVYYFSRVFKEYCGITPGRFVRSVLKS